MSKAIFACMLAGVDGGLGLSAMVVVLRGSSKPMWRLHFKRRIQQKSTEWETASIVEGAQHILKPRLKYCQDPSRRYSEWALASCPNLVSLSRDSRCQLLFQTKRRPAFPLFETACRTHQASPSRLQYSVNVLWSSAHAR